MISTKKNKAKQVTILPGSVLKWKGRIDSRHGENACNAYIERLRRKLEQLEAQEVTDTEIALKGVRKEAAVNLAEATKKREQMEKFSDPAQGTSVESIRESRKKTDEKNNLSSDLSLLIEKLAETNETIIHENIMLIERLHTQRSKADEKIYSYISGIRSGKLKSYEMLFYEHSGKTKNAYDEKHLTLDQKINAIAVAAMTHKEGKNNEII